MTFLNASSAWRYDEFVVDAAPIPDGDPRGVSVLPSDLTPAQLAAAPTLASVDLLLIEDLSDSEDDAFAAALRS